MNSNNKTTTKFTIKKEKNYLTTWNQCLDQTLLNQKRKKLTD